MYIIINPTNGAGMGSYIWQSLRCIRNYPQNKYYIIFSHSPYKDTQDKEGVNPFDYYFKQPFKKPTRSEIESVPELVETENCEYRDFLIKDTTPEKYFERRLIYNDIINKFLIPTDELTQKIDTFYNNYIKGKKVVGMHLRGTDHPDKQPVENYFTNIDKQLEGYDYVFVSTDEQRNYDLMLNRYGNKIIGYNSIKSSSSKSIHSDVDLSGSDRRKAGEDVIIEAYLLSKCNSLILGTNSNVNYLTRAINPYINYKFIHTPSL